MKYFLRVNALGPQTELEISEEQYNRLADARKTLIDALAFEQRYEALMGNFLDLEAAAAELSLKWSVQSDISYATAGEGLRNSSRVLANFLSAAKAYVDQVPQDFKHLPMSPGVDAAFKSACSDAYDSVFEYRFMEALRNYVQHNASAVHSISTDTGPVWSEAQKHYCYKEKLALDKRVKAKIIDEMPEKVELRQAARVYMKCFSEIHISLRRAMSEAVTLARAEIDKAISDYRAASGTDSTTGLCICKKSEGVQLFEGWQNIMGDWDDVRLALAKRNRFPIRLPK